MSNLSNLIESSTSSHKNNIMQIAVFELNSTESLWGMNVSKIKSFVRSKDCVLSRSGSTSGNYSAGFVYVQNETYPVIMLEEWLGFGKQDIEDYDVIVLTEFNQTKLAFPVKKINRIYNKSSDELERSDFLDGKVTYVVRIEEEQQNLNKIKLAKLKAAFDRRFKGKDLSEFQKEKMNEALNEIHSLEKDSEKELSTEETITSLCMVVDVESLLFEISGNKEIKELESLAVPEDKKYSKKVLFAEDSTTSQKILKNILTKIGVEYEMFIDGEQMINRINKGLEGVGLIVTDLEMPNKDGFQVLQALKDVKDVYKVVNSSMSNEGVKNKALELGANEFIEKTNAEKILELVTKTCV